MNHLLDGGERFARSGGRFRRFEGHQLVVQSIFEIRIDRLAAKQRLQAFATAAGLREQEERELLLARLASELCAQAIHGIDGQLERGGVGPMVGHRVAVVEQDDVVRAGAP